MLLEGTLKAELKKNDNLIDLALLTFEEYDRLINSSRKYHSNSAYETSVNKLNDSWMKDKLARAKRLHTRTMRGLSIAFFGEAIDKSDQKYLRYDEDHNPVFIDNQLQYYSKKELEKMFAGKLYTYDFYAVDEESGKIVGVVQDEWGCLLVMVASEYRGLGIGPELVKLARTYEPAKDSGGFTPGGHVNVMKVHSNFVKDAAAKGFYSKLVLAGKMTAQRAKEIVTSAKVQIDWQGNTHKIKSTVSPFSTDKTFANKPEDWLVGNIHGSFVVYNRKLLTMSEEEREHQLSERLFLGAAYAGSPYHQSTPNKLIMHTFGGKNDKIKKLLMACVLGDAEEHGDYVRIQNTDLEYVDMNKVTKDDYFFNKSETTIIPHNYLPMYNQLKPLFKIEAAVRKKYDKYDELTHWLTESLLSHFAGETDED